MNDSIHYIGDGVYADFSDNYGVELTTDRGHAEPKLILPLRPAELHNILELWSKHYKVKFKVMTVAEE